MAVLVNSNHAVALPDEHAPVAGPRDTDRQEGREGRDDFRCESRVTEGFRLCRRRERLSDGTTDDRENEGSNQRRETFQMMPKSVVIHDSHFLWKTRSLPFQVLFTSTGDSFLVDRIGAWRSERTTTTVGLTTRRQDQPLSRMNHVGGQPIDPFQLVYGCGMFVGQLPE